MIRRLISVCVLFVSLPLLLLCKLLCTLGMINFATASQLFALFPDWLGGIYVRRLWYKLTLAKCGQSLVVSWLSVIINDRTTIGDGCYIGQNVLIGYAEIGHNCLIASHTIISSGVRQHGILRDIPIRKQTGRRDKTAIGNDVWIGNGCLIGASVPDGCVIGMGSVVPQNLEEGYAIYGGNPVRLIRPRPESQHTGQWPEHESEQIPEL